MKWMDRVWALLVLAAAAVLGALLCGHIVGAKQAQTALLLVATTALLVLAGTLVWIGKQLQDILRRLKEQEYTSLLPNEEKNKALPFYLQLWDAVMNQVDMAKESDAAEEYERQATLQALQSQINPHFLYNTLECIRGQALMDGNTSVADMLEALGNFFRYSISRRENVVTLADEINNIRSYMLIQNYRFLNRYQFELEFLEDEEPLLGCYVPKLTLQPIVENALIHGFQNQKSGCVTLTVDASDSMLMLTVSDDGEGMDAAVLEELNRKIQSRQTLLRKPASHGNGIALQNVNRRIMMLYGRSYGLHAYSTPGRGTDVEIILPRITKAEVTP